MPEIKLDIDDRITYRQALVRFAVLSAIVASVQLLLLFHPAFILNFIWEHATLIVSFAIVMLVMSLASILEPGNELASIVTVLTAIMLIYIVWIAYMWVSGVLTGLGI